MRTIPLIALAFLMGSCQHFSFTVSETSPGVPPSYEPVAFEPGSWAHFLQNLPSVPGEVVDYTGSPVFNQGKHTAVIPYDVGRRDLQQCADALIRLRAEYLYAQQRFDEIAFHFTSGHLYSWNDYCAGIRPLVAGNRVNFISGSSRPRDYGSLRSYLDIVYAYAGTISLARELKPAPGFGVGTVIVKPGSPGHCCLIVDEAVNAGGEKIYKLVEGYTPAQSIYVLKNPEDGSAWNPLREGEPVRTASYSFEHYELRVFE